MLMRRWPVPQPHNIERMHADWDQFKANALAFAHPDNAALSGVEKVYSTSDVADFFGKTKQWVYWGLTPREDGTYPFSYRNGDPIVPERYGRLGVRRFTLPLIREIALSCHRRATISLDELEVVMAKILVAEFGVNAFAREDDPHVS